jgi:hypothetical protein
MIRLNIFTQRELCQLQFVMFAISCTTNRNNVAQDKRLITRLDCLLVEVSSLITIVLVIQDWDLNSDRLNSWNRLFNWCSPSNACDRDLSCPTWFALVGQARGEYAA